jgi:hypothetical protein
MLHERTRSWWDRRADGGLLFVTSCTCARATAKERGSYTAVHKYYLSKLRTGQWSAAFSCLITFTDWPFCSANSWGKCMNILKPSRKSGSTWWLNWWKCVFLPLRICNIKILSEWCSLHRSAVGSVSRHTDRQAHVLHQVFGIYWIPSVKTAWNQTWCPNGYYFCLMFWMCPVVSPVD